MSKSAISLYLFESLIHQGLDPATQAALTNAVARLKVDLRELDVHLIDKPACEHSLTDDGMFTVACSECGVQVDATPDMGFIEGLIEEAKENYENDAGEFEMDEEALSDLLVRASTESVVNHIFATHGK